MFLVATQVTEPQTIGLERYTWWIKGMQGCSLALMLHSNGSHPFNRDLQRSTVGKRGGVIAGTYQRSCPLGVLELSTELQPTAG